MASIVLGTIGSVQPELTVRIYQISDVVGRGVPAEAVV